MKTNKQNGTQNRRICAIALIAIIAIGIVACNNGDNGNTAPETFTVTFFANGGTPQPPTQTVTKGGKADEPTITKANNTLDGWYTESGFSTKWNFASDPVTATINLYAKWNEHIATINPFEDLQMTVKGSLLTPTEWAGVAGKIEEVLKAEITGWPEVLAIDYAKCKFIIVEKTTEYTKWKTDGDGKTIYINFSIVGNNQALFGALDAAMYSMDSEKTGDPCNCPNGTLHLVGETCCNSANCTCDKDVVGVRSSNGIAITNRTEIADISTVVTNINTAIGNLAGWGYSAETLKKNVSEITIVTGGTTSYNFATKVISIGVSATAGAIAGEFADYLDEPGIVAMLQKRHATASDTIFNNLLV